MEIFVARQPIFDLANRVSGYELLYRSDIRSTVAAEVSVEADRAGMSSQVLVNAILGIGLDRLTDGLPAFVNCSRELLLGAPLELLDPARVVIEILEDVEPDEEVVAACRRLSAAGYRIALDDFVYSEPWAPLVELADIIKVDVLAYSPLELEALVGRLRSSPAVLLAEKVETRELHEHCRKLGFGLFQGFFYSRPETLARSDLSVRQLGLLQLLNLLQDLNTSAAALEEAFRSDLSLSYKLMRIANSAAYGSGGIDSIGHAIHLLGREPLYRWIALILVGSVGRGSGQRRELVQTVLIRARLAELIARAASRGSATGPLFLVGLFSLLDAILNQPMEDALAQIRLAPAVEAALLRREGPLAPILKLVESYEAAAWGEMAALSAAVGVESDQVPDLYLEALAWARERLEDPEF